MLRYARQARCLNTTSVAFRSLLSCYRHGELEKFEPTNNSSVFCSCPFDLEYLYHPLLFVFLFLFLPRFTIQPCYIYDRTRLEKYEAILAPSCIPIPSPYFSPRQPTHGGCKQPNPVHCMPNVVIHRVSCR